MFFQDENINSVSNIVGFADNYIPARVTTDKHKLAGPNYGHVIKKSTGTTVISTRKAICCLTITPTIHERPYIFGSPTVNYQADYYAEFRDNQAICHLMSPGLYIVSIDFQDGSRSTFVFLINTHVKGDLVLAGDDVQPHIRINHLMPGKDSLCLIGKNTDDMKLDQKILGPQAKVVESWFHVREVAKDFYKTHKKPFRMLLTAHGLPNIASCGGTRDIWIGDETVDGKRKRSPIDVTGRFSKRRDDGIKDLKGKILFFELLQCKVGQGSDTNFWHLMHLMSGGMSTDDVHTQVKAYDAVVLSVEVGANREAYNCVPLKSRTSISTGGKNLVQWLN